MSKSASTVLVHAPNEGVQYTPFGAFPLDTATPLYSGDFAPSVAPKHQVEAKTDVEGLDEYIRRRMQIADAPAPVVQSASRQDVTRDTSTTAMALSPANVVKAAKSRIKELRAFLRQAKKAEKELRELERLVDAAKKPLAAVRDIRRSTG